MTQYLGTNDETDVVIGTNGQQAIHVDAKQAVLVAREPAVAGEQAQLHVRSAGDVNAPQLRVTQEKAGEAARIRLVSRRDRLISERTALAVATPGLTPPTTTVWDIAAGPDEFAVSHHGAAGPGVTPVTVTDAGLDVSGTLTASVLEITGADLAERFDTQGPVAPGAVLVIDGGAPGRLRASSRAYDTCVAGIASGAGGLHAGTILGSDNDGVEVALAGRVWCLAEADTTPIRPGDLLTTSDIEGHAMSAQDLSRAPGTVLGKAMSALDSGRGLVLALVTIG